MERRGTGRVDRFTVIKIIFICMVLAAFVFFAVGEMVLPGNAPELEANCQEWNPEWMLVHHDGAREAVKPIQICEASRNELITVEAVLPENISQDRILCLRSSRQEMEIFVDGVLRQTYSSKGRISAERASAVAYVFVELTPADSGKTLTLQMQTDSRYTGTLYPAYIGDRLGIFLHMADRYGPELLMALIMQVLGVGSILGSCFLRVLWHKKNELAYLGWGVLLASIWIITNSLFRQFLFPNISVINDIPFLMIVLMPLPFLLYMDGIQKHRYQKIYFPLCVINVLDCIICVLLHYTNTVDFGDTVKGMVGICILSIIVMAGTVIMDIRTKKINQYRWAAIGLLGAFVVAGVQMIVYFCAPAYFSGIFLAVGLVFILIMSVINTIKNVSFMERDKQQAQKESRDRARFLANMSHEIRTPINAVLGMNEMVLRESGEEHVRGYALDIQSAGRTLLSLINDILDFSKLESGKMELVPVEYDFSSMIHDISNMIALKAKSKELDFNININDALPCRLLGDEIRIRQILINLLNNAVKYTEKGSITLCVSGDRDGEEEILHFCVEDTGIGMKEEEIPKLFKAYERIDEKRNRNIEGTGLGMSITMQLLDMMGSSLEVKSEYGQGSCFSFELRQEIIDGKPIGNLEERIQKQSTGHVHAALFSAPEAQILVVDDDAVNRKVFTGLLKRTKMQIEEASSGEECLRKVFAAHYDIIFLDHMMPDMDGIETIHRIHAKENHPCSSTPVIALTANAISGAKEMYLSEGFDGFLSKPIIPDKLEKLICSLLPEELVKMEPPCSKTTNTADSGVMGRAAGEEALPEVEGLEWEYALSHFPNQEILMETIIDFYRVIGAEADFLQDCYQELFAGLDGETPVWGSYTINEELLSQYRIKVHAMKSAAALIGLVPLSGLARMLEYAARDKKMELIYHVTPAFLEEWRGYKAMLSPCVPKKEKRPLEDLSVIFEYLERLGKAMTTLDVDSADGCMEELLKYEYDTSAEARMEKLDAAVANLDSDQAQAIIGELKAHFKRIIIDGEK